MAKQEKQSTRDISQKSTLATDGIRLSGLLKNALGKELPQITDDDIRSLAAKNGFSKQETTKILKGWENSRGNDLLLNQSGTKFNTEEGSFIADKSSKSTGNKSGFQISDVIGKGNRVNDLGRLGAALLKNKPAEAPSKTSAPDVASSTVATETSAGTTGAVADKKTTVGGGKGTGVKTVAPVIPAATTTKRQPDDGDLLLGDQSQVGKYVPPFGQLQGGFQLQQGLKAKNPGAQKTVGNSFGPDTSKNPEWMKKIKNSEWGQKVKSQSDLENVMEVFTPALALYGLGGIGKGILKGAKGGLNALRSRFAKMPSTSTSSVIPKTNPLQIAQKSSVQPQIGGSQQLQLSGKQQLQLPAKQLQLPAGRSFPQTEIAGSAVKPRYSFTVNSATQKPVFKVKGQMRAGGVLPKMGTGGTTAQYNFTSPELDGIKNRIKNFDIKGALNNRATAPQTGSTLYNEKSQDELRAEYYPTVENTAADATSAPGITPTGDGERNRKIGSGNGLEKVFNAAEQHGPDLIKYALPFIGAGAANKYYKQAGEPVKFNPANIMTGTVQSMQRPNFGQSYSEPKGNDLLSNTVGQKIGAGMQRAGEAGFEMQNSANKISQKNMIVDRYNQGEMFNSQMKTRNDMFNAQRKTQSKFAQAQNVQEPLIAAQHMLAGDRATAGYLKADRMTEWAKNALKYSSDATARSAADEYLRTGKIPVGYKGGNSQWTQQSN